MGYGHPRHFWCDFVSALRMTGYDGVLSMEHEDSLMTAREGLEKGVRFLQSIVLTGGEGKSDVGVMTNAVSSAHVDSECLIFYDTHAHLDYPEFASDWPQSSNGPGRRHHTHHQHRHGFGEQRARGRTGRTIREHLRRRRLASE